MTRIPAETIQDFVNYAGYDDGLPGMKEWLQQYGKDLLKVTNDKGETAFIRAASMGRTDMMTFLAGQGATIPESRDDLPFLIWMARNASADGLRWLLDRGADPDQRGGKENTTALHWAAFSKHDAAVKELLAAGANTELEDDRGRTALSFAVMVRAADVIKLLAAAGANMNAPDAKKDTPLHYALTFKNAAEAEALLSSGADMFVRDSNDVTLFDKAATTPLAGVFTAESQRRGEQASNAMHTGTTARITTRPRLMLKYKT